jgi:hypothetical protein
MVEFLAPKNDYYWQIREKIGLYSVSFRVRAAHPIAGKTAVKPIEAANGSLLQLRGQQEVLQISIISRFFCVEDRT